ncbi:MAG: hypothetical protein CVV46_15435 [Spirochaetae bacterium HGW-Spirochaetae-2]|nr:MAG: hypothetical protein CVV46_15435 [Spirochaetae bacterium HGW-Spirochaetae-2]
MSYVATHKKLTPIVDNRLNEIDVGVTEQMTDGQIQSTYPDFWHAYFTRTSDFQTKRVERDHGMIRFPERVQAT